MSTAYRPLPVVTRRPKTQCRECVHEWVFKRETVACDLTVFTEAPDLAYGEDARTGLCDYFKPTLRTRFAWWLGLRERETLTFVDGEGSESAR